jgi:hypothetical protein
MIAFGHDCSRQEGSCLSPREFCLFFQRSLTGQLNAHELESTMNGEQRNLPPCPYNSGQLTVQGRTANDHNMKKKHKSVSKKTREIKANTRAEPKRPNEGARGLFDPYLEQAYQAQPLCCGARQWTTANRAGAKRARCSVGHDVATLYLGICLPA